MFHHQLESRSFFVVVFDEFRDTAPRYAFVLHAEFSRVLFIADDFSIDRNVERDLVVLFQKVDLFALFCAMDHYKIVAEAVIERYDIGPAVFACQRQFHPFPLFKDLRHPFAGYHFPIDSSHTAHLLKHTQVSIVHEVRRDNCMAGADGSARAEADIPRKVAVTVWGRSLSFR